MLSQETVEALVNLRFQLDLALELLNKHGVIISRHFFSYFRVEHVQELVSQ